VRKFSSYKKQFEKCCTVCNANKPQIWVPFPHQKIKGVCKECQKRCVFSSAKPFTFEDKIQWAATFTS